MFCLHSFSLLAYGESGEVTTIQCRMHEIICSRHPDHAVTSISSPTKSGRVSSRAALNACKHSIYVPSL